MARPVPSGAPLLPLLLPLLLLALGANAALPLPPYINRCSLKLDKEALARCQRQKGTEAFSKIVKGDRRYRIPPLDPLAVDKVEISDGRGLLGLDLDVRDVRVHGLKRTRLDNVIGDFANRRAEYDVYIPAVEVRCHYNISGRILVLPITGDGKANLTLQDMYVTYEFDFDLQKRADGETYFIPKPHSAFRFNTSRLHIHLDNLFNGDRLLGDATNRFMNENWEEMLKSVGPIFSSTISEIMHNILTNIFELVPLREAYYDADKYLIP